ncbi:MAG TPA: hypothetical protein VMU26_31260 [Candidatus Polarisedimenticolia bacterium]|nr:hypothetical protein [Candidatus Polarisedimenticolia bacterium]
MSVRNGIILLLALSAFLFLAACGSSNISHPVAPPSGNFSNSNLNGTYVFSVSGVDQGNGAPYAIAGTITANGNGGITGGTFDINDEDTAEFTQGPIANAAIKNNGTYHVNVDGRGQITFGTSSIQGFPSLTLDFVLSSSSHGLITEFDSFGSGSGTMDLQVANVTPTGSYAFSLSGALAASGAPWATVGNFTVTGSSMAGADDLNEGGVLAFPAQALTGSLVLGPSTTPSTTLSTPAFSGTFDVFAVDSTHLKFIEMDVTADLAGDAFSQASPTFPTASLAFTLQGETSAGAFLAAGGVMTPGNGGAISGTEDFNENGQPSAAPSAFTATLTTDTTNAGRYTLGSFATFVGGTAYAAYPSSGGILLLEIDNAGITTGAAYAQTASATFAAGQGYGLNLTGIFLGSSVMQPTQVYDIAEFTADSTGNTITGLIDETSGVGPVGSGVPFSNGAYTAPSGGRGSITANASSNSAATLNGGFALTFYTVDGTTFPFIESDNGQVAAGVFVLQNPTASAAAASQSHMFIATPLIRPHAAHQKKN